MEDAAVVLSADDALAIVTEDEGYIDTPTGCGNCLRRADAGTAGADGGEAHRHSLAHGAAALKKAVRSRCVRVSC